MTNSKLNAHATITTNMSDDTVTFALIVDGFIPFPPLRIHRDDIPASLESLTEQYKCTTSLASELEPSSLDDAMEAAYENKRLYNQMMKNAEILRAKAA